MRTGSGGTDPSWSATSPEKKIACGSAFRISGGGWPTAVTAIRKAPIPDQRKPIATRPNYAPVRPEIHALIRIPFPRPNHPDLVIGKDTVAPRQFHLRHVAAHAFGIGNRAEFLGHRRGRRFRVARQTIPVVAGLIAHQVGVRIVACRAPDPLVVPEETLAVRQAIRLEPHIDLAPRPHAHHRVPGAMAAAAKFRSVFSR